MKTPVAQSLSSLLSSERELPGYEESQWKVHAARQGTFPLRLCQVPATHTVAELGNTTEQLDSYWNTSKSVWDLEYVPAACVL